MVPRVLLVALVLMLLVAGCGGSSSSGSSGESGETATTAPREIPTDLAMVAAMTCRGLGGHTPDSAQPVIVDALPRASAIGYAGPELRDAMRVDCPEVMEPLESDAAFSNLFGG